MLNIKKSCLLNENENENDFECTNLQNYKMIISVDILAPFSALQFLNWSSWHQKPEISNGILGCTTYNIYLYISYV